VGRLLCFDALRRPYRAADRKDAMYRFRRPAPAKSVMFAVNYDDGRTAYLWVEDQGKSPDDRLVGLIAKERQDQGVLPDGIIATIKRVR
jgi:hypothetical protein